MRKFYDPEYDRTVDENTVRQQYEWFAQQTWFHKTFEQFAEENFTEIKEETTNTTNKEEKDMARFEINGTIYEANDKGTYFYKSTGDVDKKGNPIMKRVSRAIYEQAFEEYTQAAQDMADAWEAEVTEAKAEAEAKQAEADKQTEENFNKKTEKKTKKTTKKSKDVAYRHQDITLTAKQVDFLREATETSFYEKGVQSTLWCDVLVDEIGGQFAGKAMTVGAMISTLREKDLIFMAVEKVNGKKSKYFGFTELGQMVLEELGLA